MLASLSAALADSENPAIVTVRQTLLRIVY
jgi:hypothetical protein